MNTSLLFNNYKSDLSTNKGTSVGSAEPSTICQGTGRSFAQPTSGNRQTHLPASCGTRSSQQTCLTPLSCSQGKTGEYLLKHTTTDKRHL